MEKLFGVQVNQKAPDDNSSCDNMNTRHKWSASSRIFPPFG